MFRPVLIGAKNPLLVCLLCGLSAVAQQESDPLKLPEAIWEHSPELEDVDLTGLAEVSRTHDETYPFAKDGALFVTTQYGAVRVHAWANPLVRVKALIKVGAADERAARKFAEAVDIKVVQEPEHMELWTQYPATENDEALGYSVDYELYVPEAISLYVDNFFGDTFVSGLQGEVTIESRYGMVGLKNLSAPAHVRAKGEFPVEVDGLARGGVFVLRASHATFSRISGVLRIQNFLGTIEIRSFGEKVEVDAVSENGAIRLFLPEGSAPFIEAIADFGTIESNMPLVRSARASSVHARHGGPKGAQHFALRSSFGSIYIRQGGEPGEASAPVEEGVTIVQGRIEERHILVEDATLTVQAVIPGDIRIEGADIEEVVITVVPEVRVASVGKARLALEGLGIDTKWSGENLTVRTAVREDMEALGCLGYRVDLVIRCPRTVALNIEGFDGTTTIIDTGGAIRVAQVRGAIFIEHAKGRLSLTNDSGSVEIRDCAGPVGASVSGGPVTVKNVYGDLDITARGAKTVVDGARAGLRVRSDHGDVRVIALAGILGDYDIHAIAGNVALAVAPTSDATFWMTAKGGKVSSAVRVTGSMERDHQTFQGRLNKGTHRVVLETQGGDIAVY